MPNTGVHFEIMGGEGSELHAFYRSVFAWPVDVGEPIHSYAQFSPVPAPDGGIGGGIGAADGTTVITVYVDVDDLDATCASLLRRWGPSSSPATTIPEIDDLRIARGAGPPRQHRVWSSAADSFLRADTTGVLGCWSVASCVPVRARNVVIGVLGHLLQAGRSSYRTSRVDHWARR